MLDLVQCDRAVQASDKAVGISSGSGENAGVVKGQVLAIRVVQFLRLDDGAFSCLAGSIYQDGWRVGECVLCG
jgi:hypothetical protein